MFRDRNSGKIPGFLLDCRWEMQLMTGMILKRICMAIAVIMMHPVLPAQSSFQDNTFHARPEKKKKAEPWNKHRFGKIKIRVRQVRSGNYDIRGDLLDESIVPALAEKFYRTLEKLPPSFLEKSRIRYVIFLDNLTLKNVPAGGVACDDTIYLNPRFNAHTVYHEIFHTFDNCQINLNRKWLSLNDKKFVYTGSGFGAVKTNKFRRKRREENLATGRFDQDFVSRYAMSNDVEDRAETFAFMVVEGPKFLERTEASPVLKRKMEYIIEMTGKKRILGKFFWELHFHPERKPESGSALRKSAPSRQLSRPGDDSWSW